MFHEADNSVPVFDRNIAEDCLRAPKILNLTLSSGLIADLRQRFVQSCKATPQAAAFARREIARRSCARFRIAWPLLTWPLATLAEQASVRAQTSDKAPLVGDDDGNYGA